MYYVYVLISQKTNKLYFGYTQDLRRRLAEHNEKKSEYSKSSTPWNLVYYEAFASDKDARLREKQLKSFKSAYGYLKKRLKYSLSSFIEPKKRGEAKFGDEA